VLQIAEHSSGFQDRPDLFVQVSLTLVFQVMNRKAGHDDIERLDERQRKIEIVVDDFRPRRRPEARG